MSVLSCHPVKRSAPTPMANTGTADAVCPLLVHPKRDFLFKMLNDLDAKAFRSLYRVFSTP